MMLEFLVGALGFFVLACVYLALAPGDRTPDECAGCALRDDPTLCGACGLPDTPPPGAGRSPEPTGRITGEPGAWSETRWTDRDRGGRAPGSRRRRNGPREETR